MCLSLDCGCCDDGGLSLSRTSFPPPPLPNCPCIPSHLSPFMFPSGNVSHSPLLEAKCERTTPESSPASPSTKGNDLSILWLREGAGLRYFWVSLSFSVLQKLIYMVKFQRRFCPHKGERSTLFGRGVCMFSSGKILESPFGQRAKAMFSNQLYQKYWKGSPWWLSGKEYTCQCRRLRFDP